MPQALADAVLAECGSTAKVVAEQQQKEKEEEERRRAEESAAADALLASQTDAGAELAADSILGGAPVAPDSTVDAAEEENEVSSEGDAKTTEEDVAESDSVDTEPAREDS